jgi:hypothetical protein
MPQLSAGPKTGMCLMCHALFFHMTGIVTARKKKHYVNEIAIKIINLMKTRVHITFFNETKRCFFIRKTNSTSIIIRIDCFLFS